MYDALDRWYTMGRMGEVEEIASVSCSWHRKAQADDGSVVVVGNGGYTCWCEMRSDLERSCRWAGPSSGIGRRDIECAGRAFSTRKGALLAVATAVRSTVWHEAGGVVAQYSSEIWAALRGDAVTRRDGEAAIPLPPSRD